MGPSAAATSAAASYAAPSASTTPSQQLSTVGAIVAPSALLQNGVNQLGQTIKCVSPDLSTFDASKPQATAPPALSCFPFFQYKIETVATLPATEALKGVRYCMGEAGPDGVAEKTTTIASLEWEATYGTTRTMTWYRVVDEGLWQTGLEVINKSQEKRDESAKKLKQHKDLVGFLSGCVRVEGLPKGCTQSQLTKHVLDQNGRLTCESNRRKISTINCFGNKKIPKFEIKKENIKDVRIFEQSNVGVISLHSMDFTGTDEENAYGSFAYVTACFLHGTTLNGAKLKAAAVGEQQPL